MQHNFYVPPYVVATVGAGLDAQVKGALAAQVHRQFQWHKGSHV